MWRLIRGAEGGKGDLECCARESSISNGKPQKWKDGDRTQNWVMDFYSSLKGCLRAHDIIGGQK